MTSLGEIKFHLGAKNVRTFEQCMFRKAAVCQTLK